MSKLQILAWLLLGAFCALIVGCSKPLVSIRDPKVYTQELDYNTLIQQQGVTMLLTWVSEHCTCNNAQEWVDKESGEASELCARSVDYALVVTYREPWHSEMARYNGSLTGDRPSEDPPEVPVVSFLCEE